MNIDVKGRNILLTSVGECKLADFGVSKSLAREGSGSGNGEDSGSTGLAGSPHWMPPEVISGRESDYKADIWALGITAIEIAEKRVPHEEMTVRTTTPSGRSILISCSTNRAHFVYCVLLQVIHHQHCVKRIGQRNFVAFYHYV
jgi:serine/threonine protein kinase